MDARVPKRIHRLFQQFCYSHYYPASIIIIIIITWSPQIEATQWRYELIFRQTLSRLQGLHTYRPLFFFFLWEGGGDSTWLS